MKYVQVEKVEDVLVVTVTTQLLDNEQHGLFQELRDLAEQKPAKILLDMQHVFSCGSVAWGVLVQLHRKIGELKICSMQTVVEDQFRTTKLGQIFMAYDSRSAALEAF